uniref:Ig-like domain-containing protein n=1 Tax=Magallana gigas TaxID=29159 RepID=A0A8W8KVP6_MAGGI
MRNISERLLSTATPINDSKNDNDERTNITRESEYGPRNASVLGKNHLVSGAITEKEDTSMTIPLNCSSSCNPPCKIAWYKDKRSLLRDNPVIDIRRDRSMSGLYHCQASGVEGIVESNPVHLTIQYIDKTASFIDNPNALVGIGILVLLLLIATAVLIAVLKLKRKRGSNNQALFQTVNKDGLIYVDLDLKDTPSTSTEAFVIHGADDRTQYVDIDFTRRADPPPDTDNEQSQNEKEKEKA